LLLFDTVKQVIAVNFNFTNESFKWLLNTAALWQPNYSMSLCHPKKCLLPSDSHNML